MTRPPAAYLTRASLAAALEIGESTVDDFVRRGVLPKPDDAGTWDWQEVDERLQNLPRQGTIYLIGFSNYVKIGFTIGEVSARMAALQTGAPERLQVVASFAGSMKDERALHRRFAAMRSYGEWFRREYALAEWIEAGCPL